MRSGADKIIVNTLLFNKKEIVKLSKYLGNNCIVGSIDVKLKDKTLSIWDNNKNQLLKTNIKKYLIRYQNFQLVNYMLIQLIEMVQGKVTFLKF